MIVVTGIGAVCALGDDPNSAFDALCLGRSGIGAPWPGVGPVARVGGVPPVGVDPFWF